MDSLFPWKHRWLDKMTIGTPSSIRSQVNNTADMWTSFHYILSRIINFVPWTRKFTQNLPNCAIKICKISFEFIFILENEIRWRERYKYMGFVLCFHILSRGIILLIIFRLFCILIFKIQWSISFNLKEHLK